ncbi:MAG: hypothetical protein EORIYHIE_000931 [Candidatus Fervidibacter sp.]
MASPLQSQLLSHFGFDAVKRPRRVKGQVNADFSDSRDAADALAHLLQDVIADGAMGRGQRHANFSDAFLLVPTDAVD